MKLNDIEIKKAKTRLIITSILGVSIGIFSGLTNSYIGLIPSVFFLGSTSTIYVILAQQIKYKSKKSIKKII